MLHLNGDLLKKLVNLYNHLFFLFVELLVGHPMKRHKPLETGEATGDDLIEHWNGNVS